MSRAECFFIAREVKSGREQKQHERTERGVRR